MGSKAERYQLSPPVIQYSAGIEQLREALPGSSEPSRGEQLLTTVEAFGVLLSVDFSVVNGMEHLMPALSSLLDLWLEEQGVEERDVTQFTSHAAWLVLASEGNANRLEEALKEIIKGVELSRDMVSEEKKLHADFYTQACQQLVELLENS